jgi:hypothetical protein
VDREDYIRVLQAENMDSLNAKAGTRRNLEPPLKPPGFRDWNQKTINQLFVSFASNITCGPTPR